MIPPLDLRAANVELNAELTEVFAKFVDSGRYVLGPEVAAFETEYARYCEADHCVGVSSGLDALHLALRAADIGAGDEVIVAANTYIATWLAVTHAGAKVVAVEPDAATCNIDSNLIEEKLTSRTRAILATNLYGLPVDYDRIAEISRANELIFITDNAQAGGARYKDRAVGGIADLECHSFYPTKNLGALGEAGAVTTCRGEFAERIRTLRNYGSKERYHHLEPGFNNRLDELQAGILRVKLRYLDKWNARRRQAASRYSELLRSCPHVILPREPKWAESVWHLYVVQVSHRSSIQQRMADAGIGCAIHYPVPPHLSPAYANLNIRADEFPIATSMADSVLSLPMSPHLQDNEVQHVATSLRQILTESSTFGGLDDLSHAA